MHLLIAEDNADLATALATALRENDHDVDVVEDGEKAWEQLQHQSYDILLLDVMMPRLDGIRLCQRVRAQGYTQPILLLTARDASLDKVEGLDAGADDYLIKPIDVPELLARIRAILRRQQPERAQIDESTLTWGALILNAGTHETVYGDQPIRLTPTEFSVLELFLNHGRRVLSCSAINQHLWPAGDGPEDDAIRTHIKTLRHKLKAVGAPSTVIETVFGVGYRLGPDLTVPDSKVPDSGGIDGKDPT